MHKLLRKIIYLCSAFSLGIGFDNVYSAQKPKVDQQKPKQKTKSAKRAPQPKKTNTKNLKNAKKPDKPLDDAQAFKAIKADLEAIKTMNIVTSQIAEELKSNNQNKEAQNNGATPPPMRLPFIETKENLSIFHFKRRPGIALIRIDKDFWLFFKGKHEFDKIENLPQGATLIQNQSSEGFTVFRIKTNIGVYPVVNADKHAWKIEFLSTPRVNRTRKVVNWPTTRDAPFRILMQGYSGEMSWKHPETNISYSIFTSRRPEATFCPFEKFPQFNVLESYAGVGILSKTDSLVAKPDNEGEDLQIFDGFGIIPKPHFPQKDTFMTGTKSKVSLMREYQILKNKEQTPEVLLQLIFTAAKLSLFNDVGVYLKLMDKYAESYHLGYLPQLDLIKLIYVTVLPKDENTPKNKNFLAHYGQSDEYDFWFTLYQRKPQNYAEALDTFVKDYPNHLKNRITEIILTLPDEAENLEKLINLPGIDQPLIERAKLKLALMPPVQSLVLEELSSKSPSRLVQAQAMLALAKAKDSDGSWKTTEIIEKLEPYLFSYGEKEFEAKYFLSSKYIEAGKFEKAIHLLKAILLEFQEERQDVQEKIQKAYISFFKKTMDEENKSPPNPLDVVAFYNDFGHLTPEDDFGKRIVDTVVGNLEKLSLIKPALEILSKEFERIKEDNDQKLSLAFRLAKLHLTNRDPDAAEKMLNYLSPKISEEKQQEILEIKTEIYILRNNLAAALALYEGREDISSLKMKHRLLWKMQDYGALAKLLPQLIEKADEKERPIFALHMAATNVLLSPHPYTFDDLRQKYSLVIKGSQEEKAFNVLTTPDQPIQNGLVQFEDIDKLINYAKSLK